MGAPLTDRRSARGEGPLEKPLGVRQGHEVARRRAVEALALEGKARGSYKAAGVGAERQPVPENPPAYRPHRRVADVLNFK